MRSARAGTTRRRVCGALVTLCAVLGIAGGPPVSDAQEAFSVRVGVERTSGDYGRSADLEDLYVPVTGVYAADRYAVRVTIPYLELTLPQESGAGTTTVSGLGDVLLAASVFDVLRSQDGTVALDLTGKIKFGTADEAQGLGTGEQDYSLQMDVLKFLAGGTLIGTLGYKARGEPLGWVLDDSWYASLGGLRRQGDATRIGFFFDYHGASLPGLSARRELTALWSRELSEQWQLQAYLVGGLSDASPDWGASLSARMGF